MPRHQLTVAYTGRPELEMCRVWLERLGAQIVERFDRRFDLGISAAGTHIFTASEIANARLGIVNLHLAPLPEYRGRFSATHAILHGSEYGVTLHYVDEGIDTGPIIAERRFPISVGDTAASLRAQALILGLRLFEDYAPLLIAGRRLPSHPQDESKARYFDRHSLPAPDPSNPLLTRALTA